jgi:hypothetical protein
MRHYDGLSSQGNSLWMESARSAITGRLQWYAVYDINPWDEEILFDMMMYQQALSQKYSLPGGKL